MIHMVFMKLEDGFLTDAVFQEYCETFRAIASELPEDVKQAEVFRNCVDREQNMDLMIKLELNDPSALGKYLQNPHHIAIGKKMNPHVVKIASFDYEA